MPVAQASQSPSCQDIAKKIIDELKTKLENAQKGLQEYEKKNQERIDALKKEIDELKGLKRLFSQAKKEEEKRFIEEEKRIEEILKKAVAHAKEQINELLLKANEEKEVGNIRYYNSYLKKAQTIQKQLENDNYIYNFYTIKTWKKFLKNNKEKHIKTIKAFEKGEAVIPIFHIPKLEDTNGIYPWIGYKYSWNDIKKKISSNEKQIERLKKKEKLYYISSLHGCYTARNIKNFIEKYKKKLEIARNKISDGTYQIKTALGYNTRNQIKKLLIEQKRKYRSLLKDWILKRYCTVNPCTKDDYSCITNGEIEEQINFLKKKLEKLRRNKLPITIHGQKYTYQDIIKALEKARRIKDIRPDEEKKWLTISKKWAKARKFILDETKQDIKWWQQCLSYHYELLQNDFQIIRNKIDYYNEILDQIPCAGIENVIDDEKLKLINHHKEKLAEISENEEEKKRRIAHYEDEIHVEKDGQVHGNPKKALKRALSDVLPPMDEGIDKWLMAMNAIVKSKFYADYIGSEKTILERVLQKLGSLFEQLSHENAIQNIQQLKNEIDKVKVLFTSGPLSPENIKKLMQKYPEYSKEFKRLLQLAKKGPNYLDILSSKLKNILSLASRESVKKSLASTLNMLRGTATSTSKNIQTSLKSMSSFERGLVALSAVAAAATAYKRIEKGQAASEAVARSLVDFTVDLTAAGIPILTAAEIGSHLSALTIYLFITHDKGSLEATFSGTSKWLAQRALDQVANAAAYGGEASVALERIVYGQPNLKEIVANVRFDQLRLAISEVEDRLSLAPPGSEEEERLLRIRRALRRLLRAKQGKNY